MGYQDLRADSVRRKRYATEMEKYYHYRHIKRGQLGLLHYDVDERASGFARLTITECFDSPEIIVVMGTKRRMYDMAQLWPRPPTYHRVIRSERRWNETDRRKKAKEDRKSDAAWTDMDTLRQQGSRVEVDPWREIVETHGGSLPEEERMKADDGEAEDDGPPSWNWDDWSGPSFTYRSAEFPPLSTKQPTQKNDIGVETNTIEDLTETELLKKKLSRHYVLVDDDMSEDWTFV